MIWPVLFIVAWLLALYAAPRLRRTFWCLAPHPAHPLRCHLHPRDHVGSHEAKFRQDKITTVISWDGEAAETAKPGIAALERELQRPLADLIAEAERKAIAIHSPVGNPRQIMITLHEPPTRHPFDPCYLPGCAEARSQHEHVEVLGAGHYVAPDPFMPSGMSEIELKLRDTRAEVWAELNRLAIVAHTPDQWQQWDQLADQLQWIDAKLEALCRLNTTPGPGRRSKR